MPSFKEDIEEFMKMPYDKVISTINGSIKDYRIDLWTKMFPWGVKKESILDYYRSDQYASSLFKEAVDILESSQTHPIMPQCLADTVARYQVVQLPNGIITDPRVLYWGCGNAIMMFELIGMDKWNITLADVPGTYFQFLRYLSEKYAQLNGLRFIEVDKNNEHPLAPHKKYDIIICDGVLQHVLEPTKTLQYLCEHLEDMGHIYVSSIFAAAHQEPDPTNVSLLLDTAEQKEKWTNLMDDCGLKAIASGEAGTVWQKVIQTTTKPILTEKKNHIYPTSIAFLATLPGEKCGISTYTGWLSDKVGKHYPVKIFRDMADTNIPENAMIIAEIEFGIFPITEYKETLINSRFKDNWKFAVWHTVIKDLTREYQTYIQDIDTEYDAHIVHTAIQKAWLSKYVTKPIYIIPHGTLLWEQIPQADAKEKLGLSKDDRIAFAFGFAAENKGLDELILAAKKVKHQNFKMVISAGVHGIASEYTEAIKNKLQKEAEDSNVTVLGKYLTDDEINLWASASDALIFNYKTPPYVASASGAMKRVLAAGRTIICVNDNRLEELVDGQQCLKYTIGDIEGLARSIDLILSDSDMSNKLGNNCRLLAEQTSWEKTAEKLLEVAGKHAGEFGSDYYDEEYFVGEKGGKKFVDPNGNENKWSYYNPEGEWLGAEPIMKAIKEILNPSNMLSVGEGRGTFTAYARDAGIDAIGMDFSKWAVEHPYPRAKGLVQLGDVRDIQFPDFAFDMVFCSDILEHVYLDDLPKAISEIQRVSNKWIFYNIGASMQNDTKDDMVLQKNKLPKKDRQVTSVAGHVTVKPESWWREKLSNEHWILRDNLVERFRELVPKEALENWRCVLITERVNEIPVLEKPRISTIDKEVVKKTNIPGSPKISFVMITARGDYPYTGRPDLHIFEPTIESFKTQTMMDFEWIIVDQLYDERKDYFKDKKLPFKVKHVPAYPNVWHDVSLSGVCTQYNKGIIYADGELLFFLGEGYLFTPEFCERLWAHYKEGYVPFAWYFYDNTFAPKDIVEPVPNWKKGYPEDMETAPVSYNISGYIGKNIMIEHRPIQAFKGNDLKVVSAPWEWWFGLSSTPLQAMLKINGFNQWFDGDRMLLDCDVGSRLQLAGLGDRFALFRDLFTIRARTDTNTWNPKLVKCGPTIKCNLPLIHWSRFRNRFRANECVITDEDIRWIKDEFCGKICMIREQCRTEHPWQFPFEHKEGYGHLSEKKWFDYWRTHQEQINLTEEREKRISGDEKYKEGTFT